MRPVERRAWILLCALIAYDFAPKIIADHAGLVRIHVFAISLVLNVPKGGNTYACICYFKVTRADAYLSKSTC